LDGSDISTTEAQAAADAATRHAAEEVHGPEHAAPTARELGLWLLALRSFLDLRNYPFNDLERAELLTRNFTPDARIAQQTLRRCLRLALALRTGSAQPQDGDASAAAEGHDKVPAALFELLGDAHGLCEALLTAPRVSFHAWGSFGRLLARELDNSEAVRGLMRAARAQTLLEQQPELFTLTERLTPDTLGADMHAIFARLALLLDELRVVEDALRHDLPLMQHLPLFTLAHEEARTLIELIERRALRAEELDAPVHTALDSTSYAVSMELCKVFAHELVGLAAEPDPTAIFTRIENAHGLLRECFQQTVVALAQVFDPVFDGTKLFPTFRTRLEQSLVLRRDLWLLLEQMRRAEKETAQFTPLLAQLRTFQAGSMAHLMYKDWEAFDRFVHELKDAGDPDQRRVVLHRFGAFLETLFGQINMRTVLAEHPFDASAAE
jgi:hypothetical protein